MLTALKTRNCSEIAEKCCVQTRHHALFKRRSASVSFTSFCEHAFPSFRYEHQKRPATVGNVHNQFKKIHNRRHAHIRTNRCWVGSWGCGGSSQQGLKGSCMGFAMQSAIEGGSLIIRRKTIHHSVICICLISTGK